MHIYINTVEKSRTASSNKNTMSCPKTFNKTVTGYTFYRTSIHLLQHSVTLCLVLLDIICAICANFCYSVLHSNPAISCHMK